MQVTKIIDDVLTAHSISLSSQEKADLVAKLTAAYGAETGAVASVIDAVLRLTQPAPSAPEEG